MPKKIYRGPGAVFRIGDKELVRDGDPVVLNRDEEERLAVRYPRHRFETVDEPAESSRTSAATATPDDGKKKE